MGDIATIWDAAASVGDWQIDPPSQILWVDERGDGIRDEAGRSVGAEFTPGDGLVANADLYTALLISLFTDAIAGDDELLPDGGRDRRGWWAGPIGSRLWLRSRSKPTATLLAVVKQDIEQATAWMVDDGVVASIAVTTEYQDAGRLAAQITLKRRDGARAALRFSRLWESL